MIDSDSIRRYVESHIRQNVSTSIPAEIVSIDDYSTDQTIAVRPLIDRLYEDGAVLKPSVVYSVPVVFPSGGGGLISFPLAVSDTVLVVFSMRSIDEWVNSDGKGQTPLDNRHHHRSDAIAIPGIFTKSSNLAPSATDVEVKFKNMSVKLEPDNTLTLDNGTSNVVLNGSDVTITGNLVVTGTTTLAATVTSDGTSIGSTHKHSGVQSGGSNTGNPV